MIWVILAVVAWLVLCCVAADSDKGSARNRGGRTRSLFPGSSPREDDVWRYMSMVKGITPVPSGNSCNVIVQVGTLGGQWAAPDALCAIYGHVTLQSPNGARWRLTQQSDGNLCLALDGRNMWCNGAHDAIARVGGTGDDFVTFFSNASGVLETMRVTGPFTWTPVLRTPSQDFQRQLPNSWFTLSLADDGLLTIQERNARTSLTIYTIYRPY